MKKKILSYILALCIMIPCAFAISACNNCEHTWDNGSVTTAPTCKMEGVKTYTCTSCGETKTEPLAKSGHEYSSDWTSDNDYHWHVSTCEHTGETTTKEVHTWSNITTTTNPDCVTTGEGTKTCTTCNKTITVTIGELGHTYSEEFDADDTYHWHNATCSHTGETSEKIAHTYNSDNICTACNNRKPSEGIEYILSNDGEFYIVNGIGTCTDTDIVLPRKYKGKRVASIADTAFARENITSFYAPDNSIVSIGLSAFYNCQELTTVTFGEGLTIINASFTQCSKLANLNFPYTLTTILDANSGTNAFYGTAWYNTNNMENNGLYINDHLIATANVSHINIKEGTKYIHRDAFHMHQNLESVSIPNTVEVIENSAFEFCTKLTSINIPSSVKSIGDDAFFYTPELAEITLPNTLESIGREAFTNSKYYTEESNWDNGALYIGTNLIQVDAETVGDFSIADDTTCVANYAFKDCTQITNINIPSSINKLPYAMFYNCTALENVNLCDNLVSIEDSTFYNCSSLNNLDLPESLTNIGPRAFSGCTNITEMELPASITKIEDGTFANTGIYEIDLSNVTSIGHSVFANCANLSEVTLNDNITNIGNRCFENCTNLESITLPSNLVTIGSYAFSGCSVLDNITIPESVEIIYSYAFNQCSSLSSIVIPNLVTSIYERTFYECTNLESVVFPDELHLIDDYAFCNCTSLDYVDIPDTVKIVDDGAFLNCSNLNNISFDGIADDFAPDAINGTGYLLDINNWDNCFLYLGTTLIRVHPSIATGIVTIPEGTTYIASYAFSSCDNVTKIIMPTTLKATGTEIFNSCDGLKDVYIPNCYTSTWQRMFYLCYELVSFTIVDGIEIIETGTFDECIKLSNVVIPVSVTEIKANAFDGCDALQSIHFEGSMEQWESITKSEQTSWWRNDYETKYVVCSDGTITYTGKYIYGNNIAN